MSVAEEIWLKTLDGVWEALPVVAEGGEIPPESISPTANDWGSDTLTFTLQRDPAEMHPDLGSYTDAEYYVDGLLVWSGYVTDTPAQDGDTPSITVQAKGLPHELDFRPGRALYAKAGLSAWQDARSLAGAPLGTLNAAGTVETGSELTIGQAKGSAHEPSKWQAVILDLGDVRPTNLVLEVEPVNITGNDVFDVLVRQHPTVAEMTSIAAQPFLRTLGSIKKGVYRIALDQAVDYRFLSIALVWNAGTGTASSDHLLKIKRAELYGAAAWESGGRSALRASDVVLAALARAPTKIKTPSVASAPFSEEVLSQGPLGFWRMRNDIPVISYNEIDGVESGPHSNRGITITGGGSLSNSPGPIADGRPSYYALFDGANDAGTVDLPLGAYEAITVMFWLWWDAYANDNDMALEYTADAGLNAGFHIIPNGSATERVNVVLGDAGGAGYEQRSFTRPSAAAWHHYAIVLDRAAGSGSQIGVYIDTVLQALTADANRDVTGNFADSDLFAMSRAGLSLYGAGRMAELAVVPGVMSPDEVSEIYAAGVAPRSGTIQRTLFNISEYAPDESTSIRQRIEAVDVFHRRKRKITPEGDMIYEAGSNRPLFEVGSWGGSEFTDASLNSGDEVYNMVDVEGTDASGQALEVQRTVLDLAEGATSQGAPQPANPGFETNLTGWSGGGSRSTVQAHSGVASAIPPLESSSFSEAFTPGRLYRLWFWHFVSAGATRYPVAAIKRSDNGAVLARVEFQPGAVDYADPPFPPSQGWWRVNVAWEQPRELTTITFAIASVLGTNTVYFDDLVVEQADFTVLDRRSKTRSKALQVGAAMKRDAMATIGEAFLRTHRSTPMKGSLKIEVGGLRRILGGGQVHPSELLRHTGEQIRLNHRVDPDTGALGRDGTIAGVSYDPASETATVALDNERDNLATLLSRYESRVGGGG